MNFNTPMLPAVKFAIVIVLAIAVVIYAQVVWQQYQESQQVVENEVTEPIVDTSPQPTGSLTDAERQAAFAELRQQIGTSTMTDAERQAAFERLRAEQTASGAVLTDAERQAAFAELRAQQN